MPAWRTWRRTGDPGDHHPWFLGGGFLGALVFTIVAALAQIGRDGLPWIAGALALYLVAVNEA